MLESSWRPQKSKDQGFLHQSWAQLFFFNSEKYFFCGRSKKNISKKWYFLENFSKNEKVKISQGKIIWFFKNRIFRFLLLKFSHFFQSVSEILFFGVEKKVEYNVDVKNCDLSITDVFGAIRALLLPKERLWWQNSVVPPYVLKSLLVWYHY